MMDAIQSITIWLKMLFAPVL